ncbi:MAG: HEPN domain-containing protein [Chloroflexi bacterium]|nr:HEPN domain-containing protein [Chloroflexota bacterium]
MTESEVSQTYLRKAEQSLAGAESEFINDRYDNSANRCYYACFQAAISALLRAGVKPGGPQWGHEFVQARFVGELINRRKLYPADLRQTLSNTLGLRRTADYGEDDVNQREAARALRWTRPFIEAVQGGGERL